MAVRVVFFGRLADHFGREQEVAIDGGASSVGAVIDRLSELNPSVADALARERIRCAVNDVLAGDDARLRDGDELALFPPFSGG